ncbi:MAG: hypothetical protein ACREEM_06530, partial [Blastocatellia bacterium]
MKIRTINSTPGLRGAAPRKPVSNQQRLNLFSSAYTDMKKILIVTMKLDPHADAVIDRLEQMNEVVFRLNSEDLLNDYSVCFEQDDTGNSLGEIVSRSQRSILIPSEIKSAYYRKPKPVTPHIELTQEGAKEFAVTEGQEALRSLYAFPGVKWINSPFAIQRAQIKFPQLAAAKQLGFRIPRTLITNDPDRAHQFCRECRNQVICKSLLTTSVKLDDLSYHTYTHKVAEKELEDCLSNVRYAPTLFQEYIPKKTEIRATVMGDEVFACEIDSQVLPESSID